MDTNERFLELLTKKLSGDISDSEQQELVHLLQADPALEESHTVLNRYFQEPGYPQAASREAALQKTLERIREQKLPARRISLRTGIAAVLVVALVLTAVFFYQQATFAPHPSMLESRNASSTRSTIQLEDGTKVWLNAESTLRYPSRFGNETRELMLDGEAFFEVARDSSKPFIIHLARGTVRVLGTSFNVRAFSNDKLVETSVASGKVAFIPKYSGKARADTFLLEPDHKASFSVADNQVITRSTSSSEDKAWIEGKLVFRSRSFVDIAMELERSFGKKVVFRDSSLAAYRLTGSFQDNSLSEILYYLSRTRTFHYTITDEQIIISK